MRRRAFLALLAAAILAHSAAFADGPGFAPRTVETGAYLDLFGSHEEDNHHYQAKSFRWDDDFFKEKLTLFLNGYCYHPQFLQYRFSVGGGFKQENFRFGPYDRSVRSSRSSAEYDARVLLLPEHSYNLELFGRRYEPLVKEEAASRHNNVETSRGALFRFRTRDYSLHGRYADDRFETDGTSSDVTRFGVDAEYLKRYRNGDQLSLSAAFNPSHFSNTSGLSGNTTEYEFGNLVDLQKVRLSSSIGRTTQDQHGEVDQRFQSNEFNWYEHLTAYLPWRLRGELTYRRQHNDRTVEDVASPADLKLTDISRDVELHLVHRLYDSLDTTYTYLNSDRTSLGGEAQSVTNALAFNYAKSIPHGRVLSALSVDRSETDNEGRAAIVNESHRAVAAPGSFRLNEPNASRESIAVFLRSPLPPYETVRLQENVHFTVTAVGNTYQIDILGLQESFALPGTYDFFVSYALQVGEFRLRSNTFGWSSSVELLDNLLTPYASYVTVRTEILSGVFPGVPLDSTTTTAGAILRVGKLRAVAEYQKLDWAVSPYRAWKAEVQYVGSIGRDSNLFLRSVYQDKYYPDGTFYGAHEPHDDKSFSASGSVQKNLAARRLILSAGGGYSRFQGQLDSTSFFVNSSVTWKVGRLDVMAGARASRSDSEGSGGASMSRTYQYYYVQLRRQFF